MAQPLNLDRRLLHPTVRNGARLSLAFSILLGLSAGVVTVFQAAQTSAVVSRVFLGGASLQQVLAPLVLLLVFILLRSLLIWGGDVSASALARRLKLDLRRRLLQHLYELGPAYAGQERGGELMAAASQGVEALDAYYSQYLPQLALAALVPFTFLLFIFPIDPLSGLILLLTAPLIPVFMILIAHQAQAATHRQWRTLSRLNAYFLDVLQGLSTLKMLARSRAQVRVIGDASERFRLATMSVLRITFLSALVLEMVATLSTAVVAVEIGVRLLYGRLSFEQAFFVLLLAPEFYLPLRLLGTRFHAGMTGVAAAGQIFAILEQPIPVPAASSSIPSAEISAPGVTSIIEKDIRQASLLANPPAIQFKDVCYTYPDGRIALESLGFEIAIGEKVAIVGPSGAGKSTILSLLLGFFKSQSGEILVGGVPLGSLPMDEGRRYMAWMPQKPYLFNDTILANIRLACPFASTEEVRHAAAIAHADEFIRRLPLGYDTPIGEGGARLSGGQAQRIALARAFLQDAPLLLLDEATANLDPTTEAHVSESLQRLLQGRSALVIAHRLSTASRLDRILVLDGGRIVQQGSHSELSQIPGLYRNLLEAWSSASASAAYQIAETPASFQPHLDVASPAPVVTKPVSTPSTQSTIKRLRDLAAPFKGWIALSALSGGATVLSGIGLMGASAYLVSAAALHPSIAELQIAIVAVRFFGISRGLFRYLERITSHQVTFRLLARLRVWFYAALEPLAPARLLRSRSGDLLARMQEDIESLENFYVRVLAPPMVAAGIALLVTIYLLGFSPLLAYGVLLLQVIAGVLLPLFIRRQSAAPGRELVLQRATLNASLVDAIRGMPDLLAAGQQRRQLARLEAAGLALAEEQRRLAVNNALQNALLGLIANLALWSVLLLAIPLVSAGTLPGVYLAVLAMVALSSFEAIAPLPLAAHYLEGNLQAARRLMEIVDAQPEVSDSANALPLVIPSPTPADRHAEAALLEVCGLSFRYPPAWQLFSGPATANELPLESVDDEAGAALVLDGLDFRLFPGESVAIVGPSGAGKSTLVGLLLRFWDYQEGYIYFGGQELRSRRQEDVRKAIGVVSQSTYLFSASVRENILIARPDASPVEVVQAAERAHIHEFIQRLPDGYDTWIGEQGLRLSAGERQRIAIARALLRDAPLLILDEATTNLDAITERQVLDALHELVAGRATLVLTHRLSRLEGMREILVLDCGRVVERGRHSELLAKAGLYRRMWDLQNQALSDLYLSLRDTVFLPP